MVKPLFPKSTEHKTMTDIIEGQLTQPSVISNATTFKPQKIVVSDTTGTPPTPGFKPIAVKQMQATGITNPRVMQLVNAMNTPLGVLEWGQDVLDEIAVKSDKALDQVKDADIDFITSQMSSILTMAQKFNIDEKENTSGIGGFFNKVKSFVIDIKEMSLAEYNDLSTQMDRVVTKIDDSKSAINTKLNGLKTLYDDNIVEYKRLEQLVSDTKAAFDIKQAEYDAMVAAAGGDMLKVELAAQMMQQLTRLDKKIINFEKMQFVAMQTAPTIRSIQDNGYTLLEKFHTIKTMTIPMWKRQARLFLDSEEMRKGAALANSVDEANNQLMRTSSDRLKANSVAVAKSGQRDVVDTDTLQHVNSNLISMFTEVLEISNQGAIARATSRTQMQEMKDAYQDIVSGKK
jgi:uncharacterized protein YaaN involved in tellurite resistance